jgi:hypothetical protein
VTRADRGRLILMASYGTGDIASILNASIRWAGARRDLGRRLLALAAMLKSAQFPTHGWLTEVMETPTPVSALLHAGVINAGGFLLIRFADVMLLAPGVLAVLVMIGGFTALFGGLVMLTQSAVKTSLAWSTVAQMGFMILQCGLALFPLALLHIVAHSLYKAHAFLASGQARSIWSRRSGGPARCHPERRGGERLPHRARDLCVVGFIFGFDRQIAAGARAGRDPDLRRRLPARAGPGRQSAAGADPAHRAVCAGHRARLLRLADRGAEWLMAGTLPATPAPGPLEWALIVLAMSASAWSPSRRRCSRSGPITRRRRACGFTCPTAFISTRCSTSSSAAGRSSARPERRLGRFDMPKTLSMKTITTASDTAARAIPPVWPLASSVAVNPYLGQTGETLAETGARLGRVAGVPVTMPREVYRARIADGTITDRDITDAIAASADAQSLDLATVKTMAAAEEVHDPKPAAHHRAISPPRPPASTGPASSPTASATGPGLFRPGSGALGCPASARCL